MGSREGERVRGSFSYCTVINALVTSLQSTAATATIQAYLLASTNCSALLRSPYEDIGSSGPLLRRQADRGPTNHKHHLTSSTASTASTSPSSLSSTTCQEELLC